MTIDEYMEEYIRKMGTIYSANKRMRKFNELLKSWGSNIRVIGEYVSQSEEALFKCSKCGEEFRLKPVLAKNLPKCRVCEYKKPERHSLVDKVNEEGAWTVVEIIKKSNSMLLKCNDCGEEYRFTDYKIKSGRAICSCKSGALYTEEEVKTQALRIYGFMRRDSKEFGYLRGTELDEYIKDIIVIDTAREPLKHNQDFYNDVVDEVDRLYEERNMSMCPACKRLFPAHKLYKGVCYSKDIKQYCCGLPEEKVKKKTVKKKTTPPKNKSSVDKSHINILETFMKDFKLSPDELKDVLDKYIDNING